MSDEDLAALVVYLRSVKPVRNPLPQTRVDFPVKYLIRNAPEPIYGPVPGPPPQNQIARGKYLVRLGCGCHTPSDKGQPIPGTMLAGGAVLKGPWGLATSANLTLWDQLLHGSDFHHGRAHRIRGSAEAEFHHAVWGIQGVAG